MKINKADILEQILDTWAEACGGEWHHVIALGKGSFIELETVEDTYRYSTMEEAAKDCLYTIRELLKEV